MMKNFFKGFIIGVGKIIPGVSGSMLAISFGVYERALKIVSSFRKARMNDFVFLFFVLFGVFFGICVFSKGVKWLLSTFYFPTMLLFVGLIIGGFPEIVKKMHFDDSISFVKLKCVLVFLFCFLFSFFITMLGADYFCLFCFDNVFVLCFMFFVIGFLEAFSSIVPGISGTAIFMALGCYDLVLSFYENIFNPDFFVFGFFFFAGVLFGVFLLARVITFLFDRFKCVVYFGIFGFMLSSVLMMVLLFFDDLEMGLFFGADVLNFFFCLFIIFVGFCLGFGLSGLLESD